MKRYIALASVVLLLSQSVRGQQAAIGPEFEVAEIKQNRSGGTDMDRDFLPGGTYSVRNMPLKMLLGYAFGEPNQLLTVDVQLANQELLDNFITGAPWWVDTDRFDVLAKAPPGTTTRMFPRMLRVFLERELKLAIHKEDRLTNVYALSLGKGTLRIQQAAGSGDPSCRRFAGGTDDLAAKGLSADHSGFQCVNMTMADFAVILPRMAPNYIDRVVVDATGLQGTYDFKFAWVGKYLIDQGGIDVFGAINQLGLKLEARKAPLPYVVIDHIERPGDH